MRLRKQGLVDFIDYLTSPEGTSFDLSQLRELPESSALHFTPNGDIFDFTFLTAEGREFVVAGFSMVRRGNSLHWYMLGGEVFSKTEWLELCANQENLDLEDVPHYKRPFLAESMKEVGQMSGPPVALEGTATAIRTVIAGETDLTSCKHLGRCFMSEQENSFQMLCDDPDVFGGNLDAFERVEAIERMRARVEEAAAMWGLAETMFQLAAYFAFKVGVAKSVAVSGGKKLPANTPRGGRGVGTRFRYVSSIEFVDSEAAAVRPYTAPHYQVETEGHWRRLSHDSNGVDAQGNAVSGKTWIRETNKWRERPDSPKTIYVKSSIAAAKIKLDEFLSQATRTEQSLNCAPGVTKRSKLDSGVLYVLRCTVMKEEVYKVGWTSGTAEHRAKELSSATGVPSSFAVVASWPHHDPKGLETGVHAKLAPYRINDGREFFQTGYDTIKKIVEAEIVRTTGNIPRS